MLRLVGENAAAHPYLFAWYYATRDPLPSSVPRAEELAERVAQSRERARRARGLLGAAVDVFQDRWGLERTLARLAESFPERPAFNVELVPLAPPSSKALIEAIAFVRAVWPAMSDEMEVLVRCLGLVRAEGVTSFSHLETHGAIFINADRLLDPRGFAEELVHEASHVRLNAAAALTSVVEAHHAEARYKTPLRKDPRPFIGAFHQMFVLARLYGFWSRAERLEPTSSRARVARYRADLKAVVGLMNFDVPLTEAGREIVSQAKAMLAAPLDE